MIPRVVLFLLSLMAAGFLRGADAVTFSRKALGAATLSLPDNWATFGAEVPVWIHLHGATEVVEREFGRVGAPGVLVTLTLPGLSKVYAEHFADAGRFGELLAEVKTTLAPSGGDPAIRVGRVTVTSFSAGFGGVRQLLLQPENFARISGLVMADSIYCGYSDAATRKVDAELMSGFVKFAREAAEGRKRMVVSHSAQLPPGYASTTETADHLITALLGSRDDVEEGVEPKLRTQFVRGQLEVLGFAGEAPEDHLWHLRNLGNFIERAAPVVVRSATTLAELREQLTTHVTRPRFRGASWGVKVASLDHAQTLFEHDATRLLSPASNAKLYVGALALDWLGSDYRIVTPVLATVKPDSSGQVSGDVVISGRGDPSWNTGAVRNDFDGLMGRLADAILGAGVKRVSGDLIADATFFRGVPWGGGWTSDDLNDYYGAEVSALSIEDNYADLRVMPGTKVGSGAVITLVHSNTGLALENHVSTGQPGSARRIEVRRLPGEKVVHLFGTIPLGGTTLITEVTVPRPAEWFARALKAALSRRGVVVEGSARAVLWPEGAPAGREWVQIAEINSAPLRQLVADFMKPSQNLQTDLIFAHLGEKLRPANAPEWRSSEYYALGALRDFLRRERLHLEDVRFDEGSGLSRNNLTTARATLALLTFMASHREAEAFYASLPIGGVDGSLRRRMKDTAAENNVRAKTGTLRWSNSLSGYVTTAAGERLAFSVMLNRAVGAPGRSVRDDVDAIAEMLARFSGRLVTTGSE